MANFCTNCGNRLGKDDNFCTNCGLKIDKSDMMQDMSTSTSMSDNIEKRNAKKELKKVVGGRFSHNKTFHETLVYNGLDGADGKAIKQQVEKEIDSGQIKCAGVEFRVNQLIVEYKARLEKEKEERNKKIKMIDEILDSQEIKSEVRKNKNDPMIVSSIKDKLNDKIIKKRENMSEDEIKHFIKSELEKDRVKQEKRRMEEQERARKLEELAKIREEQERVNKEMMKKGRGGYCGFGCRDFYEEFLDENGGIVGDFDPGGAGVDYYCASGHSVALGSFCKHYKK